MNIEKNIYEIKEKVTRAALRVGRKPEDITIVAVTKTVGCDEVFEAYKCGINNFAENRVQFLLEKQEDERLIKPDINWHLIGHLQTNKVKSIVDKVSLIHSLESIKLATEINKYAEQKNIISKCLLEINVSGEESKFGLSPDNINLFLDQISGFSNVKIEGVMTMAPRDESSEMIRSYFRKLYNLGIDISKREMHNIHMSYISMGMSGDFEIAVEEGASIVRIGTAIFH